MNMTDPIADMLTRIRNGVQARMTTVDVAPASKVKVEIAKILKSEGYIDNYAVTGEGIEKKIVVTLKDGRVISGIKRISKPGLRVYAKGDEIPKVLNGYVYQKYLAQHNFNVPVFEVDARQEEDVKQLVSAMLFSIDPGLEA